MSLELTYTNLLNGDPCAEIEVDGSLIAVIAYDRGKKTHTIELQPEMPLTSLELEPFLSTVEQARAGLPVELFQ